MQPARLPAMPPPFIPEEADQPSTSTQAAMPPPFIPEVADQPLTITHSKRGRPKGSQNKPKDPTPSTGRGRGRT